ncbi:MAG: membrane protein insertase YidC [Acidobacteriota bacterium]
MEQRSRIILAIFLSTIILIGWPLVMKRLGLMQAPAEPTATEMPPAQEPAPTPPAPTMTAPAKSEDKKSVAKTTATVAQPAPPQTQVAERDLIIDTPFWRAKFSNRGAVATSWIIKQDGTRQITAANGNPLELIPQDEIKQLGAPFRYRIPWAAELTYQLNQANFQIEGANESEIALKPGEQREITFTYQAPGITARKTFKFDGGKFVFDTTAEVVANGEKKNVELVLGPRIGDATNAQTGGSYANHYQAIAYTKEGSRVQVDGAQITHQFAKITQIDEATKRIQIDKPLASDVEGIKIIGGDGKNYISLVGFARVTEREGNNQTLTLDALPEGVQVGNGVGQAADTLHNSYAWAGVMDHYFSMLAIPPQAVSQIALSSVQLRNGEQQEVAQDYPSVAVPVDSQASTKIFIGPKDRELLIRLSNELGANLEDIIDYGMFRAIVRPIVAILAPALDGLGNIFKNYGWAIVAITAVVNLLLFPLRWYSSKKMKQAAKHQPRIKELQEKMKKLKENPKASQREIEAIQREQMEIMKEANPMGGCLPMLLQMPIFWSFFIFLTISLDMRHAHWLLWVKDLSKPDPLHILPIIMCVTMIASTALMPQPAAADPSMKMQRTLMTWVMPIMLTWFFFLSAPSGLVLYWMVSNIVGVAIQLVINKMTAEPQAQPADVSKKKDKKPTQRSRNVEA